MNFRDYRILHKKMSLDLSQPLIATFITYVITYSLLWFGLHYWNVYLIIYLYTFFYILLFSLNLKAETVEARGDLLLLKFISYSPVEPSRLYFFSYIERMWFNLFAILEIIIPCLIFYLFNIPIITIIIFVVRIHLLVLAIIYLRYVILWVQRISYIKIYLKIIAILILSILPLIPYNYDLSFTANLTLYFDALLLIIFTISLFTYRPIINQLVNLIKQTGTNKVIIFTRTISRIIFYPIKRLNRTQNILSIYYAKLLRSSSLNNQYVTVIMFMSLILFVTNFSHLRDNFQLVNYMSFILCLNVFHRIKYSHALKNVIWPEYIPLHYRFKQAIEDFFHFINVFFIWILLLLQLSIQHSFSLLNIFQGFILFISYFLITLLFEIPEQQQWHSKKEQEEIKKKTRRKSIILSVFMVFISFAFGHIIVNFPLAFCFIFLFLIYLYWLIVYKHAEK